MLCLSGFELFSLDAPERRSRTGAKSQATKWYTRMKHIKRSGSSLLYLSCTLIRGNFVTNVGASSCLYQCCHHGMIQSSHQAFDYAAMKKSQ